MLRTLSIRDFVIVDSIELEFAPGFTVLTGETGAGKSILIDALTLALGGRGDASVVREGAARTEISAEFDGSDQVDAWLAASDFSGEEGGVLLRRVIDNSGRSRAFINGGSATAAQLREIGEMLVDIHGQHAHQSLLRGEAQRALLDGQGGLQDLARDVAQAHRSWKTLAKQRERFEADARNVLLERERLEWQVSELGKLGPRENEWAAVTNEHSRLANAASLIEGAQEALDAISESEEKPMLSQLGGLTAKIGRLASVDAGLNPVLEALEPALIQLQEAVSALNDYLDRVELDPERLRQVEMRMEALHASARKFRIAPDDLAQEYARLSEQLRELADASDLEALREQERKLESAYIRAAARLSDGRVQAALSLGAAVTAAMQELSMAGGRFEVALRACEPAAYGVEQVEFLVAAHAGTSVRPLVKVASGGELARISLAIAVIASTATATSTLIFDEVDSGIGGAVAEVVGRLLRRLGGRHQVLCVTHLPQVASQANQHFQVVKQSLEGRTLSSIQSLHDKARVEEIARMLGGLEITATTRKHARELLAS
jgi:DNA repair protein RecN (Recombination protein N)